MQFFKKKEEQIYKVEEVSAEDISRLTLVSEEHGLRLCKDKSYYHCILQNPLNVDKNFSLSRITSENEAKEMFARFNHKLALNLDVFGKEIMDVECLQKLTDAIRLHENYNLAHLSTVVCVLSLFKKDAVKSLINEADKETKETALFLVVEQENVDLIRAMLAVGASLDVLDIDGNSIYHKAAKAKNCEIIKILGSKDKSKVNAMNSSGQTPLHEACTSNLPNNVIELLALGANPCTTEHPNYPIHFALQMDSLRSVEMLCKAKKCQSNRIDKTKEDSPLHWARSKEALCLLLRMGAELEKKNSKGETALMKKVKDSSYPEIITCLYKGADINTLDNDQNTPLMVAIMNDNPIMVKLLLSFGAEVNPEMKEGESNVISARHKAAVSSLKNKDAIVYYLHSAGACRCGQGMKDCNSYCSTKGTNNGKAPKANNHSHTLVEDDLTMEAVKALWSHSEMEILKLAEERMPKKNEGMKEGEGEKKEKKEKKEDPGHRILCINAGRLEGLMMLKALMRLEEVCARPVKECFDWIGGNGSGAFIAIAIMQGRSLKQIFNLYLELCQELVFNLENPCTEKSFESRLKSIFGEDRKMSEYDGIKVLTGGCRFDERPIKKILCRNYELQGAVLGGRKKCESYMKPSDILCWRAAKWSGFADAGVTEGTSKRFMDGCLMGNDPIMDTLLEIHHCNVACLKSGKTVKPIHLVVSLGGECSMAEVVESMKMESFKIESLKAEGKERSKEEERRSLIGRLLMEHAQHTDAHTAMQAKAWCHMVGAPLIHFHPSMPTLPRASEVLEDPQCLVSMLWEADMYLKEQSKRFEKIAALL